MASSPQAPGVPSAIPRWEMVRPSAHAGKYEHVEYYIEDEMVIFLVENCYFKVHKYFFQRDSEIFRAMFACPSGEAEPEGRTQETAISLPGVAKEEMTALLQFFYSSMYDFEENKTQLKSELELREDWVALLSISTRYAFDRIRARAIDLLKPSFDKLGSKATLEPVDAIVLAVKHDVTEWLDTAYALLVLRDEPLNVKEGEKLGIVTVVHLAKARERFWREEARNIVPTSALHYVAAAEDIQRKRQRAKAIVSEVFHPPVDLSKLVKLLQRKQQI